MARKSLPEKILLVVEALVKETGALLYPYKGIGRSLRRYRGSLAKALYELKRRGYLEEVEIKGRKALRLTLKGKIRVIGRLKKPRKWDGQWRLIAFDIEEKRKKTRNLFRLKLNELGCQPLQKSLWISPYDVSESIEKLITLLGLEGRVYYFLSPAILSEEEWLEKFGIVKDRL